MIDQIGDYLLIATDPQSGCIDTALFEVFQADEPTIVLSVFDSIDCTNENSVLLSGTGSDFEDNTGIWTGPGLEVIPTSNPFSYPILVNQIGFYTFTLIVDSTGCVAVDSIEVFGDDTTPFAEAGFNQELNCATSEVTLSGLNSSIGSGFTYEWGSIQGNIISGANTLSPVVDEPGIYELVVTYSELGCTAIDEVVVFENAAVPSGAFITSNELCFGQQNGEIIINEMISGNPPYLYSINTDEFSDNETFNQLSAGDYFITAQDVLGCEWDTIVTINERMEMKVDLGPDVTIELGDSLQIQVETNTLNPIFEWSSSSDEICDGCAEFNVLPLLEDLNYQVTVTDELGCMGADEIVVKVIINKRFFTPTAFSPNSDGINDIFFINGGQEVKQINDFEVYTRWGELVFRANQIPANDPLSGWNGRFKGKIMDPQVFAWRATIEYIDGDVRMEMGDVILVK